MGHGNGKVLLGSTVVSMLESQGWSLHRSFNNEYIFRNSDGEILAIPQHRTKPHLIYLNDLLNCTQVLRQEFIAVASQEWDIANSGAANKQIQFDIWLDPGDASGSDIGALFSSLSDLNRAAGGFGLTFDDAEAVGS